MAFLFLPFIPSAVGGLAAALGLAAAGAGAGAIGSLSGRQRTVLGPLPQHRPLPSFPDLLLPRILPEMKKEPVAVVATVPFRPNKPQNSSSESESDSDSESDSMSLPSLPSLPSSSESESDDETTDEEKMKKKKEKKRMKEILKKMKMVNEIGKMMSMKKMTSQNGGTKSVTVLAPPPEPSLYRTSQRAVMSSASVRGGGRDRQAVAALYFSKN